jgi:hypothetical protein
MHRFSRWKVPLTEAQSVQQVVKLMRDYVATIGVEDLGALPETCRQALTAEDIQGSAVILVREELQFSGDPTVAEMLHEIAHTFVAASTRMASVQARGQPLPTASEALKA